MRLIGNTGRVEPEPVPPSPAAPYTVNEAVARGTGNGSNDPRRDGGRPLVLSDCFRSGFWRVRQVAGAPPRARSVVAVIPARDEAPVIGRAIASLEPIPLSSPR